MKPDYWKRLAGAARRVPVESAPEMPFGFETRLIADWQAQREGGEAVPWARLLPGALGNEASAQNESFSAGGIVPTGAQYIAPLREGERRTTHTGNGVLLDYPHYTRPAEFRGWAVPEVLIGGNHAEVAKWRRAAALEKTRRNRPDLLLRG